MCRTACCAPSINPRWIIGATRHRISHSLASTACARSFARETRGLRWRCNLTATCRKRLPYDAAKIEFVCSDMWKPYLGVIREKCSQALNILDRFHIVAKVNKALDDIRSAEARRMKGDGYEPVLTKARWCLLKRPANLTANQKVKLKDLVR